MPTIATIAGVRVTIYGDDHNPPHFHLIHAGRECQVRISDLAILEGSIPRTKLKLALAWAAENKLLLARHWIRINGD